MIHRNPLIEVVRSAAPRICAAAGRDYDPVLLREGLPVEGELGPPGQGGERAVASAGGLSDLISAWLATHPDRRRDGVYLTPRAAARSLLRAAATDGFRPRAICDPAVGAGVFLEEAISLFGPGVRVWGIDSDPVAVALSRLAVWLAAASGIDPIDVARRIRLADSLLDPDPFLGSAPEGGFDLVCGNPPFGNAIEKRTARPKAERSALRSIFPETARGPYDRSLLFVDLAVRLLSPGGRYALLVPRALLAARYAIGLRGLLERVAPVEGIVRFERDAPVPECEIFMVGWIGKRSGDGASPNVIVAPVEEPERAPAAIPRHALSKGSWGVLLDPDGARVETSAAAHPKLGDFFEIHASASVAEAYALSASIREAHEAEILKSRAAKAGEARGSGANGDGWSYLTVRHIARYRHRWGSTSGRILGRRFRVPFLPRGAHGLTARRAALYDRPKVIVAGLSKHTRAICDAEGAHAGSVGTLCAVPRGIDGADPRRLLRRATLLLNSGWISAVHRARRGPLALTGGSIPMGKPDLAALPFPLLLARGPAVAGEVGRGLLEGWFDAEPRDLPGDPDVLLAILDAAAGALLDGEEPIDPDASGRGSAQDRAFARRWAGWDSLVQRVIDAIAVGDGSEGGA